MEYVTLQGEFTPVTKKHFSDALSCIYFLFLCAQVLRYCGSAENFICGAQSIQKILFKDSKAYCLSRNNVPSFEIIHRLHCEEPLFEVVSITYEHKQNTKLLSHTYILVYNLTGLKVCLSPCVSPLPSPSICSIKLQGAWKTLLIPELFCVSPVCKHTHTLYRWSYWLLCVYIRTSEIHRPPMQFSMTTHMTTDR